MNDELITQLLLSFFSACVLGPALGAVWGRWKGFESGMAVGCLIIGLTGLTAAAAAALYIERAIATSAIVQGTFVNFVVHSKREKNGEISTTRDPIVEYVATDGRVRQIKGLGGSQGGSQEHAKPGDPVMVRYQVADPERAVIADMQNLYGPVIGLGLFGLLPTLFGLFFLMEAREEHLPTSAPSKLVAPSPWFTRLTLAANLVIYSGFAIALIAGYFSPAVAVSAGLMTIGVGSLLHFVAQHMPPAQLSLPYRFIFIIVGLGSFAFGAATWLLFV